MTLVAEPKNWILGDDFNTRYDHFGSMKILWEKKWKYVYLPSNIGQDQGLTGS